MAGIFCLLTLIKKHFIYKKKKRSRGLVKNHIRFSEMFRKRFEQKMLPTSTVASIWFLLAAITLCQVN